MKYPKLAELLKKEYEKVKSVRKVCEKAGISPASYYNYTETDTTPDTATIEKIAHRFGIEPTSLMNDIPVTKTLQDGEWLPIYDDMLREFRKLPLEEQYRVIADLIEKGKSSRQKTS